MSELNREQALDILDRFDFFQGQRAGRELWNDKPFDVQEEDLKKFSKDVASLKAFINELTEENERLRGEFTDAEAEVEKAIDIAEDNIRAEIASGGTSCHWCEDKVRADTVREMQTRVAMCFGTYTDKDMTPIIEVFRRLDRIAKEMVEENK